MKRLYWLLTGSLSLIVASASAWAVEKTRVDYQGAAGMCKPALATYGANLRIRPLGIDNDSGSDVYITCNWQGDDSQNSIRGARKVSIVLTNNGASEQAVSCTLVNGFQSGAVTTATYTPKTVTIAAGAAATIEWLPADVAAGLTQIKLPALSCLLPGGMTMQYTTKEYNEDVGA